MPPAPASGCRAQSNALCFCEEASADSSPALAPMQPALYLREAAIHKQLDARNIGPVSVRTRVAELNGSLVLSTSPEGVDLRIDLPA